MASYCAVLLICAVIVFTDAELPSADFEALECGFFEHTELDIFFSRLTGNTRISEPFDDNEFILSAAPGFHDEPFDLIVSIPSIPEAVIYWTIDGNEPTPGEDRFIVRGDRLIQVSGRLPKNGEIGVHDRSGYWRYAILTSYFEEWRHNPDVRLHGNVRPARGAEILQGTAFRFRGFINQEAVTEILTATYIVAPDAAERFTHRPVIMVTAPYEEFLYIYSNACTHDLVNMPTRRRVFNYEYYEWRGTAHERIFNMLGSTSLGGSWSRMHSQRTLNVHLSRGELNGVVTHPIFDGLYELYRFRLWNGGSGPFRQDHMRDIFAQTASAELNALYSDHNLAIKFINGEYWGFISIREHTTNAEFIHTRTGIAKNNIAIMERTWFERDEDGNHIRDPNNVNAGPQDWVRHTFNELIDFTFSYDLSTDYARERLFYEYFCQDNFIDFVIAHTFFNDVSFPQNNVRFFRAIVPDCQNANNPYNDGRWRFILHDMDAAPCGYTGAPLIYTESRFNMLYRPTNNRAIARVFGVFNNQMFVEQFVERALWVLDNDFHQDRLLALHDEFVAKYEPLLPEMYNRFPVRGGNIENSLSNFHYFRLQLRTFLENREYYYRQHLAHILERVS